MSNSRFYGAMSAAGLRLRAAARRKSRQLTTDIRQPVVARETRSAEIARRGAEKPKREFIAEILGGARAQRWVAGERLQSLKWLSGSEARRPATESTSDGRGRWKREAPDNRHGSRPAERVHKIWKTGLTCFPYFMDKFVQGKPSDFSARNAR